MQMPYGSIDLLVTSGNVYKNLQNRKPDAIFYDFWNANYWQPFTLNNS